MVIVVGGGAERQGFAHGKVIAQDQLRVFRIDFIQCGQTVAAGGIVAKIGVGQAEITLIGTLIRILKFKFYAMARICRRITELDGVVLNVQPGIPVASVDGLKPIGQPLMRLQQKAEAGI